jgi:polar amino acid transport system substrate-binding protein
MTNINLQGDINMRSKDDDLTQINEGPAMSEGPAFSRRRLATMSIASVAAAATLAQSTLGSSAARAQGTGSRLDRILSSGTLRLGHFLQYKPYGFKNEAGEPDGFDVDVSRMLADDMGVKAEFVDNTWDGIIPGLLSDKFDMVGATMTITLKRCLAVQFSVPHAFTNTAFIIRSENAGRFSSLEKFNDPEVTVSILLQDASHVALERFFPKAKVVDFNTAQDALLAMQTQKADVSCSEMSFLVQYANEHPGLTVVPIDIPGSSSMEGLAMQPGTDSEHLRAFVNTWIQFYFWTGRYEPLWKKWYPWTPLPKIEKFMAPV